MSIAVLSIIPYKTEAGASVRRRDDREEVGVANFEDGGTGHESRNAGCFWKLEKARNRFFPRISGRNSAFQNGT